MNCIIIDDEPLAQELLEQYISEIPDLVLIGAFKNGMDAMNTLQNGSLDLMFLDINMPKISGLDLLRSLRNPPITIITTAYRDHGIEAYELDAIDYLEKPFSFHRFLRAINKAQERKAYLNTNEMSSTISSQKIEQEDYMFVKTNKKLVKIMYEEIIFIESISDYVRIHLNDKKVVLYESLKNIETWLPVKRFPRVHKSFIISVSKIEIIEGNRIKLHGQEIPIGASYRKSFLALIDSMSK